MARADTSLGYADVAVGCSEAAVTACMTLTALSFESWRQAVQTFSPVPPARRTWYTKPTLSSLGQPNFPFLGWPGFIPQTAWPATNLWSAFPGQPSPAAWGAAWLALFPLRGPPASWPMAYALLASGVPRAVALPAAEINAQAIEVADAAMKPMRAFATYRSDGGHATSVIMWTPQAALAAMLTASATWPWLGAAPASFMA